MPRQPYVIGPRGRQPAKTYSFTNPDTFVLIKRAFKLLRPFWLKMLALVILIIITSGLGLLPVLCIKEIVNEAVYQKGSLGRINLFFGLMIGLHVANSLLGILHGYLNLDIGQRIVVNLRKRLHDHVQRLSLRFYTETRTGEILSRITTDVNGVQGAITGTFTDLLTNTANLIIALGLMFHLDLGITIAAMIFFPLWIYPTLRIGDRLRVLQRSWQEEAANMAAHISETLSVSGSMLVKGFGRQDHEGSRFQRVNQALRALRIKRFLTSRWFFTSTQLFGSFTVGLVYWFGARSVVLGDIPTVGDVVAIVALSQRVLGPFRQIMGVNVTIMTNLALFERIFEYIDLPVEIREKENARTLAAPVGHILFKDVTFSYSDDVTKPPVIDTVSFEALPGQVLALVGPSGAGKTTIANLIQRFFDPKSGQVMLDGNDLRELTLETISRTVGCVAQETYLFHNTLMENIRYGRLEAKNEDVLSAADAAGLYPLIATLPDGLVTMVGERGYRLSGGEKQRVALARAFLKNPPVLILDEATSSLDTRLEREIRETTKRLARGRTTIIIAHRLSTVIDADLILVLDEGRIAECGCHSELIQSNGLYASLYSEQALADELAQEDEFDSIG